MCLKKDTVKSHIIINKSFKKKKYRVSRRTRQATPGTQRYPAFNVPQNTALQSSPCAQGLGSSASCPLAALLGERLPCRVICTWKWSPQPQLSWLPDGPDRQHQVHRDNPSITLLGARHTRAPMASKSRAAHQQSVPGETHPVVWK